MVLRVKPTPTRFPTNRLYTPVDKHTLAFYIKCVPPVGRLLPLRAKDRVCQTVVRSILLYDGETWPVGEADERMLAVLDNDNTHRILHVRRRDCASV